MADLEVKTWGPTRVSPGQTIDYIIEVRNDGVRPAENAVLVDSLPSQVKYISSAGGGIYRWETHEVIWKLGTISAKSKKILSVKVEVQGGLPGHSFFANEIMIGTTSDEIDTYIYPESKINNIQEYIEYNPVNIESTEFLPPLDFQNELNDPLFRDMYDYSKELGYRETNIFGKIKLSNGSTIDQKFMISDQNKEIVIVTKYYDPSSPDNNNGSTLIKIDEGENISVFNRGGGITLDNTQLTPFGTSQNCNYGNRLRNCMNDKIPNIALDSAAYLLAGIPKIVYNLVKLTWDTIWLSIDCIKCQDPELSEQEIKRFCEGCFEKVAAIPMHTVEMVPFVGDLTWCAIRSTDPTYDSCTYCNYKTRCSNPWFGIPDTVMTLHCSAECEWIDAETYPVSDPKYRPLAFCPEDKVCRKIDSNNAACVSPKNTNSHTNQVTTAGDPNMKYGLEGNILAGQKLNYKVEYNNEGEGIAFGVYFTDTLDAALDDSTLEIGPVIDTHTGTQIAPPGNYNPATRTITWMVGEVGPSQGGYAEFSINAKSNAQHGTEIINYGTVYFPSVPETTRTNGVVSYIPYTITATAGSGGTIEPSGTVLVSPGAYQSFTITPNTGYHVEDVKVDDSSVGKVLTYTFPSVATNYTIEATFEKDDKDGDGMLDDWEIAHGLNPNDPSDANLDPDNDGLTNLQEYQNGTNPNNSDTDNDGMPDGWEVMYGLNPNLDDSSSDKDNDGYSNLEEYQSGSNPNDSNSIPNQLPVSSAGQDQNAIVGTPVTLDGSGSYDPEGATITYLWSFKNVPPGSSVNDNSLSPNASDAKPTFIPDLDGSYKLNLIVNDGSINSTPDEVIITAKKPNVAPNANAGPDQNVLTGTTVYLNGNGSSDPDNGPMPLSYLWSFYGIPPAPGSSLTNEDIMDKNKANASFIPDVDGMYTVRLTVSDGDRASNDDTVVISSTPNVPPNANAGSDITITLGQTATLNGSASNDPDNGPSPITYSWRFVTVPSGSQAGNEDIAGSNTVSASFTPDVVGTYVLELTVSDGLDYGYDNVAVTLIKKAGTLCSILGNNPNPLIPDIDIFKFRGTKGETVTIRIEANPPQAGLGKRLTLILTDKIKGTVLLKLEQSVLPNEITAKLPATGEYLITVAEQILTTKDKRFKGDYCLTLKARPETYQTLAPYLWVE